MLNLTSLQVGKIFFNECFVVLMSQERMMKVFTQLKLAESVHSYRLWVNQFTAVCIIFRRLACL